MQRAWYSGALGTIDPDQSTLKIRGHEECLFDPIGQCHPVDIAGADQDTVMRPYRAMEGDEVATVESEDDPTLGDGEGQNCGVCNSLIALASLLDSQQVMAAPAQLDDHLQVEVLVGIQSGHLSCFLVGEDGPINLLTVTVVIRPGHVQIVLAQIGMTLSDLAVGESQPPPLHES